MPPIDLHADWNICFLPHHWSLFTFKIIGRRDIGAVFPVPYVIHIDVVRTRLQLPNQGGYNYLSIIKSAIEELVFKKSAFALVVEPQTPPKQ